MNKSIVLALIAGAATLSAGAAHAGNLSWQVGINLPVPRIVLPVPPLPVVVAPQPVYYEPARPSYSTYSDDAAYYERPQPAYYEPAPVVYQRPAVVYQRPAVYYRPVPVVVPSYSREWHHHRHEYDRHDGRGWRRD